MSRSRRSVIGRVALGLVALVVAVVPAAVPVPAYAEWSAPRRLDTTAWGASDDVDLATARDGSSVVVWSAGATAVHDTTHEIHGRRISPGGRLGPVRVVLPRHGSQVSVAVDDDGDALFAWAEFVAAEDQWVAFARRWGRDGRLGPVLRLGARGSESWRPVPVLTPRGAGAVAFDEGVGSPSQWMLRRVSRSSRLGPHVRLPFRSDLYVRLVATRAGDVLAAGTDGSDRVRVIRFRPDGSTQARRVSPDTSRTDVVFGLGADRRGTARVTWWTTAPTGPAVVWVGGVTGGGRVLPPRRVTPSGTSVGRVVAATDLEGDTVVAWTQYAESAGVARHSVALRLVRRDGTRAAVRTLGPHVPPDRFSPYHQHAPELTLDDDGHGLIAWYDESDDWVARTWTRRIRPDGSVTPRVRIPGDLRPHAIGSRPDGLVRLQLTRQTDAAPLLVTGP